MKILVSDPSSASRDICHGSGVVVRDPVVLKTGYHKDFGFGFYCTVLREQAIRWAVRFTGTGYLLHFRYSADPSLKVKKFDVMTDEWLDFIVSSRRGSSHDYDIVEGPMANDTIYNYVQDFIDGKISRAAFWELAKFKYPTHQISFHTEKALATLTFLKEEEVRDE